MLTLAQINEKYADQPEWTVTAHVDGNPDFTVEGIRAPREGLARTGIMFLYPHPLNGQHVTYTVNGLPSPRPIIGQMWRGEIVTAETEGAYEA